MTRQMGFSCLLIGVLVKMLGAAQPSAPPGKITVSETPIAKVAATQPASDYSVYISPDWRNVAFIAAEADGRQRLIVNGTAEKPFDRIADGRVVWSPDGKRLAYVATDGASDVLLLDGKEAARHKLIGSLTFSPDGKRFAYGAQLSAAEYAAVVDGVATNHRKGAGRFVFSADSKRIGYVLTEMQRMISYEAVIDGVHAPVSSSVPRIIFSADGRRAASMAQYVDAPGSPYRITLVENGTASTFDGAGPLFSPDGRRFAYGVTTRELRPTPEQKPSDCRMVLDGLPGKAYASFVRMLFSPDSRHLVYQAQVILGGASVVVVDGVEGPGNLFRIDDLVFSPDGSNVAYNASCGPNKQAIVVNTRIVAEGNLRPDAPVFSIDGKWIRYITNEAGPSGPSPVRYVGVDGTPWPAEKSLRDVFPRRLFVMPMQQPGSKDRLFVGGHVVGPYDRILMEGARCSPQKESRFFAADLSTVRFFAIRSGQLLAVEVKYEWPQPK